ncbi:MAG: PEGA domain-containing protein [Deltaproteobacteria bacterium]|nr:PEGA domain-containing protein [Deltaproteobacteria bacterium]
MQAAHARRHDRSAIPAALTRLAILAAATAALVPPTAAAEPVEATTEAPAENPADAPTGTAQGETGEPPAEDEAVVHFREGVARYRNQDFDGALVEFRACFACDGNPALRYNIGACLFNLERWAEARMELARYLAETEPSLMSAGRRAEVQELLSAADTKVALIDLTTSVEGVVGTVVEGATVTVDGIVVGVVPLPVPVAVLPGPHLLAASMEGHAPFSQQIEATAGQRLAVVARLEAIELPPVEPPGGTPPGGVPGEGPVDAAGDLDPLWFYTSVGLTGALLVGTIVSGALLADRRTAFEEAGDRCTHDNPQACLDQDSIAEEGRTLEAATIALGALTGAAAVATLVLGLYTDFGGDDGEAGAVEVGFSPLLGADGTLAGAFLEAGFRF